MKKKRHQLDPPERKDLIERLASFLKSGHREIIAVYLFGSFISDGSFSDIDIGILLKEAMTSPLEYELNLETKLDNIISYPVDIRILNNAPPAFCREVIRRRSIILDRDPSARADFEGLVLKKHFDMMFYRRRYLEEVFHAPL